MKNVIVLDTGVLSLYHINNEKVVKELSTQKRKAAEFISSELNYIELFNHLCRQKGKINAQIIMENTRQGNIVNFIPVIDYISTLAGELKCQYHFLSMVDAVICAEAKTRNAYIFTTESQFNNVKGLKVKRFDY